MTTPFKLVSAALAAALLSACAVAPSKPTPAVVQDEASAPAACAALATGLAPVLPALAPSQRVSFTSVRWFATGAVAGSAVGLPAHCQVVGAISARTAGADPIRFQINLPSTWNRKALMVGGGGYNGALTTGLAPLRDAAAGQAHPLAQGYVTFGTDSGHDAKVYGATEPAQFALNDEMFENFAHASYKRVKDVAHAVMRSYYPSAPEKQYFYGGSEGGREGLMMAQRYPADFDGIVSVVPVIYWTGLFHGFVEATQAQLDQQAGHSGVPSGALSATKIRLLANAVNTACDALDGLADGLVNHYAACREQFKLVSLRCPGGQDTGDQCLSDAQLRTLRAIYEPVALPFALANGVTQYPARFWGGEIQAGGEGLARWLSNGKAPATPVSAQDSRIVNYGSSYARYVVARNAQLDLRQYDPRRFQARIEAVSQLMDASNPDLSAFFKRGGKLIIRENTGDIAQSAAAGMAYFEAVQKSLGRPAVDASMRLYTVSPASHSGQAASLTTGTEAATNHDLLSTLDKWVTQAEPPADSLPLVLQAATAPHAVQAARPMCRYPMYAHYVGGDARLGASYRCQR